MTQLFAPTEFVITTEGEYFDRMGVIQRDRSGFVTKLNLPPKLVIISNHQVYLDWWYLWSFTYWIGGHKDVVIVLKKSLKWVPIVGWGMIWFRFIFLNRSWASDSKYYISKLASLAQRAAKEDHPLTFFLFPEGTLVSSETRPLSQKWAAKSNISDLRHTLLPRTTGLHYALRALVPQTPDLYLLDITVAYEGIPNGAYGQSYYTLRSVFLDGVPPPKIHLHLKLFQVMGGIPIGDVEFREESAQTMSGKEAEISRMESARFEEWLVTLWRQKDERLETFLNSGSLDPKGVHKQSKSLPIKLRSRWEALHACILFSLALVVYGIRHWSSTTEQKI